MTGRLARILRALAVDVLIAWLGFGATYAVDLATFVVSLIALGCGTPSRQELLGTYLVDIVAMFFATPMALFPALAESYGGGAVVGLLYAAPSAGAVVFLAASGWTARVHHHGRAVVLAACGWWRRAVSERLLRDGCETVALLGGQAGEPSSPPCGSGSSSPTRRRAVTGAGVPRLAPGRFAPLGRVLGDPRLGMAGAFLPAPRAAEPLPARRRRRALHRGRAAPRLAPIEHAARGPSPRARDTASLTPSPRLRGSVTRVTVGWP